MISGFIALPLLPERSLQGSAVIALNPDQGETVGWPRFIDTIAAAWHAIPAGRRAHTAIFTCSYQQAGAIDVLGGDRALPHAYSGHNGFSNGAEPARRRLPRPPDRIRRPSRTPHPLFHDCHILATINNGVGLNNNEQGLPVVLCHPAGSWTALWPHLTRYN